MENWNKLQKKFRGLNLEIWKSMDGIRKLGMLRAINAKIDDEPTFGKNFQIKYPEDIYLSEISTLFNIDPMTLHKMKQAAIHNQNEIGGTITFKNSSLKDINIKFSGNKNRINLDYRSDTHSLFHTHPEDDNREYDPPSILDILSYLALIVKYTADIIIDLDRGVEHSIDDPLVVQSSIVFTKDEVYVYYISHPLIVIITETLMKLFLQSSSTDEFISLVEKLLDEMEISYSAFLYHFNRDLDSSDLINYLSVLSSLGIIIKRFSENPEVYITL